MLASLARKPSKETAHPARFIDRPINHAAPAELAFSAAFSLSRGAFTSLSKHESRHKFPAGIPTSPAHYDTCASHRGHVQAENASYLSEPAARAYRVHALRISISPVDGEWAERGLVGDAGEVRSHTLRASKETGHLARHRHGRHGITGFPTKL